MGLADLQKPNRVPSYMVVHLQRGSPAGWFRDTWQIVKLDLSAEEERASCTMPRLWLSEGTT